MGTEYFLFVLLCCVASIISAVFGLGTALIVLAVGSHIIPVKDAIALGTVLFATLTAFKTVLFRKHIDWKVAAIMAIASLPFAYFGASLLVDIPAELLRRLLGSMILLYLALSIFKLFPTLNIGTRGLLAGSALYGFVSGLLGTGNVIKAIVFREMNMTKEAFVGAMAATSVLANVAKLTAYTETGLFNASQLWPMIGLVFGGLATVLVGRQILQKVSVPQFAAGVQVVLAISALALLV